MLNAAAEPGSKKRTAFPILSRVALALAVLSILLFFLRLNEVIISVHILQLRNELYAHDKRESATDHITLVATYEIHKKLYEQRISQDEADRIEQKLHSLYFTETAGSRTENELYSVSSKAALALINMNRLILGKRPAELEYHREEDFAKLNKAYYLERNMLFKQAAGQYEKALTHKGISDGLRASILLRQGYCYSLCGQNEKALHNYRIILLHYNQESSALTAAILDKYLKGFISARERTLNEQSDSLVKGKKLLSLLAYEQALEIISQTEDKGSAGERAQIEYIKGRCYSGIGEPQKAVESYLKAISIEPTGEFAKYANRKLFLIGSAAGTDNEITRLSIQLNDTIKDPILSQTIREKTLHSDIPGPEDGSALILNVSPELKKIPEIVSATIAADTQKKSASPSIVRVKTVDGNIFRGTLVEKNSARVILETSIGRVTIDSDKIAEMSE